MLAQVEAAAAITAAVRAVPLLGVTFLPLLLRHVQQASSMIIATDGSSTGIPLINQEAFARDFCTHVHAVPDGKAAVHLPVLARQH